MARLPVTKLSKAEFLSAVACSFLREAVLAAPHQYLCPMATADSAPEADQADFGLADRAKTD
jgi:hypothetical protein